MAKSMVETWTSFEVEKSVANSSSTAAGSGLLTNPAMRPTAEANKAQP